jgi:hypothetical protein
VSKPWEETWRLDESGTPQIVNENGETVLRGEEDPTDAMLDWRDKETLALVLAAPELYRALLRFREECQCKGSIVPGGACRHEEAYAALKKARGE